LASQTDENKALITEFLRRIFQEQNPPAAAELITERYIQHDPEMPTGKAGFLSKLPGLYVEFPKLHTEVKHLWAEGDYVIVHSWYRFTPQDRGAAVVDIFRIQDGKVDEHWGIARDIPEQAANANGMF
jgi:predicted SnoaL-like aldol condensation-catalyzing enzyme